jgi:hypothetical protein
LIRSAQVSPSDKAFGMGQQCRRAFVLFAQAGLFAALPRFPPQQPLDHLLHRLLHMFAVEPPRIPQLPQPPIGGGYDIGKM